MKITEVERTYITGKLDKACDQNYSVPALAGLQINRIRVHLENNDFPHIPYTLTSMKKLNGFWNGKGIK